MRIDPYHFYCQKVLPAVYDESLSYYEDVCKLLAAMQELDKSMDDLEKRMDALDQISTVLWPQFQAEVNATLQEYAKAYEDFQAGIETDISGFEAQLTTMNTTLTNAIASQNEAIAANNVAQMALLTQRLAAQDNSISAISETVQQNSQDMADLTMDVHDFIAQYSPPATINGLSPQFLIAANAGASLTAVQGLIQLTATADSEGKAVINASNYGSWAVTSVYQEQTKTVTVLVDDVKQYTVDVEQTEKTYTFTLNPIPNFADLPSIITHSMFQITGPNGYSTTKPVQATAQSFSVPGHGEYSFDLKIANIYPDASSETGYKAASASGAVIYTSTPGGAVRATMPNSSVNNSSTVTPLGLPYFQVTLPGDKQITVTSPVTATDVAQTMTAESTTYKFVPWVTGAWVVSSSQKSVAYPLENNWGSPSAIDIVLTVQTTGEVTIQPSTLNISAPENAIYGAYKLSYRKGNDAFVEHRFTAANPTLTLTLDPGSYTFSLAVANRVFDAAYNQLVDGTYYSISSTTLTVNAGQSYTVIYPIYELRLTVHAGHSYSICNGITNNNIPSIPSYLSVPSGITGQINMLSPIPSIAGTWYLLDGNIPTSAQQGTWLTQLPAFTGYTSPSVTGNNILFADGAKINNSIPENARELYNAYAKETCERFGITVGAVDATTGDYCGEVMKHNKGYIFKNGFMRSSSYYAGPVIPKLYYKITPLSNGVSISLIGTKDSGYTVYPAFVDDSGNEHDAIMLLPCLYDNGSTNKRQQPLNGNRFNITGSHHQQNFSDFTLESWMSHPNIATAFLIYMLQWDAIDNKGVNSPFNYTSYSILANNLNGFCYNETYITSILGIAAISIPYNSTTKKFPMPPNTTGDIPISSNSAYSRKGASITSLYDLMTINTSSDVGGISCYNYRGAPSSGEAMTMHWNQILDYVYVIQHRKTFPVPVVFIDKQ